MKKIYLTVALMLAAAAGYTAGQIETFKSDFETAAGDVVSCKVDFSTYTWTMFSYTVPGASTYNGYAYLRGSVE